ncbi:MAG: cytosine deaminase [Pseudomonadota bacterium]
MKPKPIEIPSDGAYILHNARVPLSILSSKTFAQLNTQPDHEGVVRVSISVGNDGVISDVSPLRAGATYSDKPMVDCNGKLVWIRLSDAHTHLDKTQTWADAPNLDGSAEGAKDAAKSLRKAPWSLDQVYARMDFGVRSALHHGTRALRTHIDSQPGRTYPTWDAFSQLRKSYKNTIELQAVATLGASKLHGEYGNEVAKLAADHGAALGPVVYQTDTMRSDVERVFDLAERYSLSLDFHVDKTLDPNSSGLEAIAEEAVRRSWEGTVLCGHCCSLAQKDDDALKRAIDLVAASPIGIVVLPTTATYSMDRKAGRTPRKRGLAPFLELERAGVPIAFATDNSRDSFYPYGDYDLIELFRDAARFGHADLQPGAWARSISSVPSKMMGLSAGDGIKPGVPADLILFEGRSFSELFARPGAKRKIIHKGRTVSFELPDFSELDALEPCS